MVEVSSTLEKCGESIPSRKKKKDIESVDIQIDFNWYVIIALCSVEKLVSLKIHKLEES